jgi:GT2 family glycosyltransferase
MDTPTDVSIIIPSYKSKKTLGQCLASLANQNTEYTYRVIVVHSGPEPINADVRSSFGSVLFQTTSERWLPAKARNWAINATQSQWLLFLDSDCVVSKDWIQGMMNAALKYKADGVGGGIQNGSRKNLFSWVMHVLEFAKWLPGGPPRHCQNIPTCNALYRRSVLVELNGFPEDIFPCEDTVLNYFLINKGYNLFFAPDCVVQHVRERDFLGIIRYNYDFGYAYGYACQKYQMPGNFLTRLPGPIFIPAVVLGRMIGIFFRLFPYHPLEATAYLIGFPAILGGLISWAAGFVKGSHSSSRTAIIVDGKLLS